jgi:hypothetical protein
MESKWHTGGAWGLRGRRLWGSTVGSRDCEAGVINMFLGVYGADEDMGRGWGVSGWGQRVGVGRGPVRRRIRCWGLGWPRRREPQLTGRCRCVADPAEGRDVLLDPPADFAARGGYVDNRRLRAVRVLGTGHVRLPRPVVGPVTAGDSQRYLTTEDHEVGTSGSCTDRKR